MIYYSEQGEQIPESAVDLEHGYLVERDVVHHDETPAVTHTEQRAIPGGIITYEVIDEPAHPAYEEVVSMTYYYTGATESEKLSAQVMYTAVMTDTLLENEVAEDV